MTATTHTPPRTPGAPGRTAAPRGAAARLPWWALALPVLAFLALFSLIPDPAEAHATPGGASAVAHLVERAQELFPLGR